MPILLPRDIRSGVQAIRLCSLGRGAVVGAIALAATFLGLGPAAAQDDRKIVVELFTSQGCNTCPPADAFLGELAQRPDVIALSLHVDYWDYLGWKDRFAQPIFTDRQRAYAASLGARQIYTPQMVVHGQTGLVGSHRGAVSMAINSVIERDGAQLVSIAIARTGDALAVNLSPTQDLSAVRIAGPLSIIVMGYDGPHVVAVGAGENTGKALTYHNVVRDLRVVDQWNISAQALSIDIDPSLRGYVVMIQHLPSGAVWAAEQIEF